MDPRRAFLQSELRLKSVERDLPSQRMLDGALRMKGPRCGDGADRCQKIDSGVTLSEFNNSP
jgi:hypothetical protein